MVEQKKSCLQKCFGKTLSKPSNVILMWREHMVLVLGLDKEPGYGDFFFFKGMLFIYLFHYL